MKTFTTYCPAGWQRLDLTGDASSVAGQVSLAAAALTKAAPPQARSSLRAVVYQHLLATATAMRERDVASIMLPVSGPTAAAIRPLIVFAPLTVPEGSGPLDTLLAVASSDPTAEMIDLTDVVALRITSTDRVTESLEASGQELLATLPEIEGVPNVPEPTPPGMEAVATRVRYLIGDPEDADRWVDIFFSLTHLDTPDQHEVAAAAIEMFDQLAKTFRWTS